VQNILSGTALYVALGCIALAVVLFRFVRALRRRRSNAVLAQSVQHWVKGLEAAEKSLARIGLVREPGETVGVFLARCESGTLTGEKDSRMSPKVQARLQAALRFLREYEVNRWRLR
jgi:hypothetical protein